MKRIIVLLLATACLTAAYLSGHSQQPVQPEPITFTKVGVVNMGTIYAQYQRVTRFKQQMERELLPFKKRKSALERTIAEWKAVAASSDEEVTKETKQKAAAKIVEAARKLEDLDMQFKEEFSKKLEDQMVALDKEITEKIQTYSSANGYHTILAYGEPENPLQGLASFKRKMSVIDQGGMVVAYHTPGTDISRDIVNALNREFRDAKEGDDE